MTTPDTQFRLRLPVEVHAKLVEYAEKNHRSINAEVLERIVSSFEWDSFSPTEMTKEINALKSAVGSLSAQLTILQHELKGVSHGSVAQKMSSKNNG